MSARWPACLSQARPSPARTFRPASPAGSLLRAWRSKPTRPSPTRCRRTAENSQKARESAETKKTHACGGLGRLASICGVSAGASDQPTNFGGDHVGVFACGGLLVGPPVLLMNDSFVVGPTWAENYELGMAAHAWGWRKSRGDGHSHVGMAAHTWGWKVYTWGWPLTRGDGGFTPGDGHSHLGMADLRVGMAKKNCRKKRIPPGLRSFRETPVLS